MHKMGERTCKHYNGLDLIRDGVELCQAGVNPIVLATGGDRSGWIKKAPCFEKYGHSNKCDKCEFPTQEEMDIESKKWEKATADIVRVLALIPENGDSGTVKCPKCEGVIDWLRTRSNGHLHVKCKTKGCIVFVE